MNKLEQFFNACQTYSKPCDEILFKCDANYDTIYKDMICFISSDNYLYIWKDIYTAFINEEPELYLDLENLDNQSILDKLSNDILDMFIYSVKNNQLVVTKK